MIYDHAGNRIKEPAVDRLHANRIVAVYKNGILLKRYLYDHAGLRIAAVDAEGQTTIYLYDLAGNLIQEREGGEVRNYVWALGKHLARVDGTIGDPASRVYWYHTDHFGTVQVISDVQGQVVWRNDYRAFGGQLGPEVREIENAQAFTGKDWDAEVGLYYFNARWYDPELGRFISEDPLGDPNNPNLYAYARNNPLVVFDPTGMTSLADIGLTPTTTGATWEELESTEIDEPSAPASTEEEVPPSPGEAKSSSQLKESDYIVLLPLDTQEEIKRDFKEFWNLADKINELLEQISQIKSETNFANAEVNLTLINELYEQAQTLLDKQKQILDRIEEKIYNNSKVFVYYSQKDPRWGNIRYSAFNIATQTIAKTGCGPTSAAMVISSLTGRIITPDIAAEFALERGYRSKNRGTSWKFFTDIGSYYGLYVQQTSDIKLVEAALKQGGMAIASMKEGHFTQTGHYVLLADYSLEKDLIYVLDPNSRKRTDYWDIDIITSEAKKYWIFLPR